MSKYILDPCVEDELWSIWQFIAKDNPDAATRVVEAAFKTFDTLATTPRLGRPRRFANSRVKDIRSLRIASFPNYLIFYRAIADGVQVLHVYHGAQDLERLFQDDETG